MAANLLNFIVERTEASYIRNVKNYQLASSYFLLGYRESFMIMRSAAIWDNLSRLVRFISYGLRMGLGFWVLAWTFASLPTMLWFSRASGAQLFSSITRTFSVIAYDGQFYTSRSSVFTINALRYIGVDVAFLFTPPTRRGGYQLNSLYDKGIVTIGLGYDPSFVNQYSYQFICLNQFSRLFLFYLRLFAYFLRMGALPIMK